MTTRFRRLAFTLAAGLLALHAQAQDPVSLSATRVSGKAEIALNFGTSAAVVRAGGKMAGAPHTYGALTVGVAIDPAGNRIELVQGHTR